MSRSTKFHKNRDEGKQVTISREEVSSIQSSTDNNVKAESVWKANLNATGVIDQIEDRFQNLVAKLLTMILTSHLKDMQYEDEQLQK